MNKLNTPPTKGYKLTLIDLDNGETITDATIDCIIGGYHVIGDDDGAHRLVSTSCNGKILINTATCADKAIKRAVEISMENVLKGILGEIE